MTKVQLLIFVMASILCCRKYPEHANQLFDAVRVGNVSMMDHYINTEGIPVTITEQGHTLLQVAVMHNQIESVSYLISEGVDLEDHGSSFGWTPLISAVVGHNADILQLLLESGADPNNTCQAFRQSPPITVAVLRKGSKPLIDILLDYGADPNIADSSGKTALDYALEYDLDEYVKRFETL